MKVYLGTSTPEQAVQAANQGDADALKGQQCEAAFYIGEWQVLHQNAAAAKPMFGAAASSCPAEYIEQASARWPIEEAAVSDQSRNRRKAFAALGLGLVLVPRRCIRWSM